MYLHSSCILTSDTRSTLVYFIRIISSVQDAYPLGLNLASTKEMNKDTATFSFDWP